MWSLSTAKELVYVLAFNVVFSLFARWINKKWCKKPNLLSDWSIARQKIRQKEARSWLEKLCLHFIYATYYLVDFPTNIARFCRTKGKKFTNIVDGIVVAFVIVSAITSFLYCSVYTPLLAGYFIWRIVLTLSGTLQNLTEVREDFTKRGVASFNRMVFILFLNVFELTACYMVFYKFLGIFTPDMPYLEAFRIVLGVFITEGLPENVHISYWLQNVLIISQFFVIVIFFLMFTANLVSLRYQEDDTKK